MACLFIVGSLLAHAETPSPHYIDRKTAQPWDEATLGRQDRKRRTSGVTTSIGRINT